MRSKKSKNIYIKVQAKELKEPSLVNACGNFTGERSDLSESSNQSESSSDDVSGDTNGEVHAGTDSVGSGMLKPKIANPTSKILVSTQCNPNLGDR
jgi:hypothetical protein